MDIIIDTNILRQDHLLRSSKFQVVFDYLKKTNSHLIIPTVVKNEMIAIFRRQLIDLFEEAKNKTKKIDNWCYDNTPRTYFNLDVDKEISTYKDFLNNLTHGGIALELQHNNSYLDEVINRQIDRIKPATDKGEEFRDIVIWLSIKDFLKQSQREAVFISNNTKQFATANNSKELNQDLAAELSDNNLRLKYFCSLDDFIQEHSRRVDFITEDWIKRNLSQSDIERAISAVIEGSERKWQQYSERNLLDWTGYLQFIGLNEVGLNDFYVYELQGEDFYLHASYFGNIRVGMELEESHRRFDISIMTFDVCLEMELKVHNKNIEDLKLESWDFLISSTTRHTFT